MLPPFRLQHSHSLHVHAFALVCTGLAAVHVGGTTLHSFAGVGLGKEDSDELLKTVSNSQGALKRWHDCKILIVDEVR